MRPIVIRFGRLGDMLLLAPLLDRLHRGYGEPGLLLGTGPCSAALYDAHPDVAQVLQVSARHRPLALSPDRWRMLRALRRHRGAPVHVCETEPRALAKIQRMLAFAGIRQSQCVFLTDAPATPGEHWIDRLLRGCGQTAAARLHGCMAHAGIGGHPGTSPGVARGGPPRPRRLAAHAWLARRGPVAGAALQQAQHALERPRDPADDDKAWPAQHWIAALRALREDHPAAHIVLCGVLNEAPLLDTLARDARVRGLEVAPRELPLRRLMALAEIADGMLSVDTGPAHVAAAMGCPLVVLFGAQSPEAWCPRSPTGSAVIALGGPPHDSRVSEISPREVVAELCSLPPRNPKLPRAA